MKYLLLGISATLLAACMPAPPAIMPPAIPASADYVTRQQAVQTALAYTTLTWQGEKRHRLHGADPDGQWVDTPDAAAATTLGSAMWWQCGNNIGMPYKWGGFDTPQEFCNRLQSEDYVYAGDYASSAKVAGGDNAVSRYAAGIDCSGLVSRCWRLDRPYSTRELGALCTPLPDFKDMQPGDIALKPGTHVILFLEWADAEKSSFYAVEAGGVPHWKCYRYRVSLNMLRKAGYTPHRYKNMR